MTGEHNPALNSAANYHFKWPWMTKSESELKQSRAEDLNSSHYLIKFWMDFHQTWQFVFWSAQKCAASLGFDEIMSRYRKNRWKYLLLTKSGSCGKAELRAEPNFNRLS